MAICPGTYYTVLENKKREGDDSKIKSLIPREAVIQNLEDAGCNAGVIEEFMLFFEAGDVKKQLMLLESHRKQLLSKVHKEVKRISCLDYLVYEIANKIQPIK